MPRSIREFAYYTAVTVHFHPLSQKAMQLADRGGLAATAAGRRRRSGLGLGARHAGGSAHGCCGCEQRWPTGSAGTPPSLSPDQGTGNAMACRMGRTRVPMGFRRDILKPPGQRPARPAPQGLRLYSMALFGDRAQACRPGGPPRWRGPWRTPFREPPSAARALRSRRSFSAQAAWAISTRLCLGRPSATSCGPSWGREIGRAHV